MGGFYMAYLESLCRRRGWREPQYETYKSSSGYTCLVLVNGREYQTDLAYVSDGQAQENAAMRAFMVCRNFSVNGGMLARNGVVQGLPAIEHSERYRRRRNSGRSQASRSSSISMTSGARRSSTAESIYSDTSLFSSASLVSSSSEMSGFSHSNKESSSTTTDVSTSSATTTLPSFEETSTNYSPSLMESTASDENLGIDQRGSLKLESGEDILDLVHRSGKASEQTTELQGDETDGMKSLKPVQDEGCEYDSYQRDSRASVKTHIWASSSSTSVAAPKNQIHIEQSIFQYFVHADTADEGFWDGIDDSDQFLKQYTRRPLLDEQDLKIEGKYGGVGKFGGLTTDNPSHESAEVDIKVERNSVESCEEVDATPNEVCKCELDDDHAGAYCSSRSSSTENTDPDISESDESDSQASFYQRVSAAMSREGQSLEHFRRPILDRERRSLVDRVMEEFWAIFGNIPGALLADSESPVGSDSLVDGDQGTSNDSNDQRMTRSSSSTTRDQITPNGEQKRKRDEQEENDNNNQRKQNPPERSNLPSAGAHTLRFACPFRKHNPRIYTMYTHRSCALSGWTTIARIKEHIYRSHRKRPYCQRCWLNFDNQQELDLHMTVSAADICEVKSGQPPDGITAEHERKLRSRKKACPTQSNEETWKDMYKILFPDEDVPSPYFELIQEDVPALPDASELADYEDYIRRELPSLVRRNLEEIVCRETQPLEASLIANLVDIVRSCQETISRSYRERSEAGGGNQTMVPHSANLTETSAPSQFEGPPAMDDHFSLSFMTPIVEDPTLEQWDGVNMPATDFQPLERSTDRLSHDSGYGRSLKSCSCRHGACSCQSFQKDDPESSVNELLPAGTLPASANTEQNEFLDFMSFSNRFLDFTECDDHLSGMNG